MVAISTLSVGIFGNTFSIFGKYKLFVLSHTFAIKLALYNLCGADKNAKKSIKYGLEWNGDKELSNVKIFINSSVLNSTSI
jgi:hypothetical protein